MTYGGLDLLDQSFNISGLSKFEAVNVLEEEGACFIAGTVVTARDGEKPVEEVAVEDEVLCADPETGEYAYRTVTKTFVNQTEDLTTVTVNGEQIISTPNHPYYVEGKGWVEASALHEGQTVWLANGTKTTVEAVSNQTLQEPVFVYNFEVEDFHTYFVGECGILVHNCNSNSPTDPTQGVTIHLKIKDGWSQDQINAAINKADALTNGNTYVVDPATIQRDPSAIRTFQSLYGKMKGYDVDHIIELQVGGDNSLSNLQFLDSSVNRSFGAQIKIQIANLKVGTVLGKFVIDNLPS